MTMGIEKIKILTTEGGSIVILLQHAHSGHLAPPQGLMDWSWHEKGSWIKSCCVVHLEVAFLEYRGGMSVYRSPGTSNFANNRLCMPSMGMWY